MKRTFLAALVLACTLAGKPPGAADDGATSRAGSWTPRGGGTRRHRHGKNPPTGFSAPT